MFVKGNGESDISSFVKEIRFHLHDTFMPPIRGKYCYDKVFQLVLILRKVMIILYSHIIMKINDNFVIKVLCLKMEQLTLTLSPSSLVCYLIHSVTYNIMGILWHLDLEGHNL